MSALQIASTVSHTACVQQLGNVTCGSGVGAGGDNRGLHASVDRSSPLGAAGSEDTPPSSSAPVAGSSQEYGPASKNG